MKYRILNKDGDTLIVTNTGFKVWIKPNEWDELNKILESNVLPNRGCGHSYTSEFEEGIAKCLQNSEKNYNLGSETYLVKYKRDSRELFLQIIALLIIALVVVAFIQSCNQN